MRNRAVERRPDRWVGHRALSSLLVAAVYVGPGLAGLAVGLICAAIRSAHRSAPGLAGWCVTVAAISLLALILLDRVARRLLPLALLLRLTLVFPDAAPSRFRSAMRSSSFRHLKRRLEEAASLRPDEALGDAATRLIELAAMLTAHDRRTRGHCERVRAYAELMAEELHVTGEDRAKLRWAALLHDIGKLVVPPAILNNKKGAPNAAEWAVIRKHPAAARALLEPLREWLGEWANAAWEHHERWDGQGYPDGLRGTRISPAGRLVAVADSYEVMTAARSYKRPIPAAEARRELLRCAGSHFDPDMVRAIINVSVRRMRCETGALGSLAQVPFLSWTSAAAAAPGPVSTVGTLGRTVVWRDSRPRALH